jgi:hypothetical protein
MNLLGKRCWVKTSKKFKDSNKRSAEEEAMKRTNKLERLRSIGFKKKMKDLKEEITFKDQKLEESWMMYKEEVTAKRLSQRNLRLHRSAS